MDKVMACLWFDNVAEEAVRFYIETFRNGKIIDIDYYDESTVAVSKKTVGSVLAVSFKLFGMDFMAMNGGPEFKFTPAISMVVDCKDQKEVDRLWAALTAGGRGVACGWLEDRYGLSWQIVPREYVKLARSKNKQKVTAMNAVMINMVKLDMDELRKAFKEG